MLEQMVTRATRVGLMVWIWLLTGNRHKGNLRLQVCPLLPGRGVFECISHLPTAVHGAGPPQVVCGGPSVRRGFLPPHTTFIISHLDPTNVWLSPPALPHLSALGSWGFRGNRRISGGAGGASSHLAQPPPTSLCTYSFVPVVSSCSLTSYPQTTAAAASGTRVTAPVSQGQRFGGVGGGPKENVSIQKAPFRRWETSARARGEGGRRGSRSCRWSQPSRGPEGLFTPLSSLQHVHDHSSRVGGGEADF